MKKKKKKLHLFLGCVLVSAIAIFLFPDKNIAMQADHPHLGQLSTRTIISPINFDIPKSKQEIEIERQRAEEKVSAIFEYNTDETNRISEDLKQYLHKLAQYGNLQAQINASGNTNPDAADTLQMKVQQASRIYEVLKQRLSITAIKPLSQNAKARDSVFSVFNQMLKRGISNTLLAKTETELKLFMESYNVQEIRHLIYNKTTVAMIRDSEEMTLETSAIQPLQRRIDESFAQLQQAFPSDQGLQSAFYEVLYVFSLPNVFYLEKETEARKVAARDKVTLIKGMVPRGMEIVTQGAPITKEILEKIEALQQAQQKEENERTLTATYGQATIIALIIIAFFFYFFYNETVRKFKSPRQLWSLVLLAIIQLLAFWAVHYLSSNLNMAEFLNGQVKGVDFMWLYPFALTPVIATVLFNYRLGLAFSVLSSLIFGILNGYDLAATIAVFAVLIISLVPLVRIRYRVQFIYAIIVGVVSMAASISIMFLLRNRMNFESFYQTLAAASANFAVCIAISSAFFVHLMERIFGITTVLTLM